MPDPVLTAHRINHPGGYTLAAWCPWCEGLHHHGETYGRRGRHCDPGSGAPFGGYTLAEGRTVRTTAAALPDALFAGSPDTLRKALGKTAHHLRRAVATACLGKSPDASAPVMRRTRRGRVDVTVAQRTTFLSPPFTRPADTWTVSPKDRDAVEGRGLLDMLRAVYAVTPGVVGVRVLETALGLDLDAEAAATIATALDAWDGRGRPGSDAGSGILERA